MSDQAQNAVETTPEDDLLAALGEEVPQEELAEPNADNAAEEGEEKVEAVEETTDETQAFKITVMNDAGVDEEKEVTLDELAKGYMLQADYTRKTQAIAKEAAEVEQKFTKALTEAQQSAIDKINQLQELVLRQAAPELNGVDWVELSVQDPTRFVQLQAKQQQLSNTYQALEQQRAQLQQAQEQEKAKAVDQAVRQSNELLSKSLKDYSDEKVGELLQDVEKHVGWKARDLSALTKSMAEAGLPPESLGKLLLLAGDAIQFRQLQTTKAATLKKVAVAPKVIKPSAPQPKSTNKAALDRLKKSGRAEDLAAFL